MIEGIKPVEYDGQIAMKDTVGHPDPVHLEIVVPLAIEDIGGQCRLAVPVRYRPRKRMLSVRMFMGRYIPKKKVMQNGEEVTIYGKMKDKYRTIDIACKNIRYAYVGEMDDYWKMEVVA